MIKHLKLITLIITLSVLSFSVFAQTKTTATAKGVRISIGADIGVPLGDVSDYNTLAVQYRPNSLSSVNYL